MARRRFCSLFWRSWPWLAVTGLFGHVAAAASLPSFPVEIPVGPTGAVLVVDLDNNGAPYLVTTVRDLVVAVDREGRARPGFPAALRAKDERVGITLAGPTACDLDGDGRPEIFAAGSDKRLYAVNGRGAASPGFPLELSAVAKGLPTCVPGSKGAASRLLVATDKGELLQILGPKPRASVLGRVGAGAEGGVAVADLDGDRALDFVTVGGDGALYVLDERGRKVAPSGYRMGFRASGTPALGDITDDGRLEVVIGSQDFKVHAVDRDGKAVPGFPVEVGYRIYAGVALGDMDGDGVVEIAAVSGDGKLLVVNKAGKALPGFPLTLDDRVTAEPLLGDMNKDGKAEVVVLTQSGKLHVIDGAGRNIAGSPLALGPKGGGAPALFDLDGDGVLEVIAATSDGRLHAVRFSERGPAERALAPWPTAGHDAGRSGRLGPVEGRFRELGYEKERPTTGDAIVARYRFIDADGDAERGTEIRWYRGGVRVPELDNKARVDAALTRKHERWSYTLQSIENHRAYGDSGVLSRIFTAPKIEVVNTAPPRPEISLLPKAPVTTTQLEVLITKQPADADGDTVSYRYVWRKDGAPQALPQTQHTIDPKLTRKSERFEVMVTPFDGELEGEPALAAVVIANTPPLAPKVALVPSPARVDDELRVEVKAPADDDHDELSYAYEYFVDGARLGLPRTSGVVPPRTLRKHQRLRVEVTAFDDEGPGGKASAELVMRNTAPPRPVVVISPPSPRATDDLAVGIKETARDADMDPLRFAVRWYKDGALVSSDDVVSKEKTRKHERWRVEVVPRDGEEDGETASAEVRIANSPPSPPLLALERDEFFAGDKVVPRILIAATDEDGDKVTLRYAWSVNGAKRPWPQTKSELTPADIRRDERFELVVTPYDGEVEGSPARLAFTIGNTAPTPPLIALTKTEATVRDRVEVRIIKPGEDRDGDKLSYLYKWYRQGAHVAAWPASKAALEPFEAKKGERLRVEVRANDGARASPPVFADLRIVNHPPEAPVAAIEPKKPTVADELRCVAQKPAGDPDGDSPSYLVTWFMNGARVQLPTMSQGSVPSLLCKGQSWTCELFASDGEARSRPSRAAAVTIINSPPSAAKIVISPPSPRAGQDLWCGVAAPALDLDFDRLTYRYEWRRNRKEWRHPKGEKVEARVLATFVRRDDEWECAVVANDGASDGPRAEARVRIANTLPTRPLAVLDPERPASQRKITCAIKTPATDVDGDQLDYLYTWFRNGIPQGFAPSSVEVPARLVRAGDKWSCAVAATDGRDTGQAMRTQDATVQTE